MEISTYQKLKCIQLGTLEIRRFKKRIVVSLITANIWLDKLITKLLRDSQGIIHQANIKIDDIENAEYRTWIYDFKIGETIRESFNTDLFQESLIRSAGLIDTLIMLLFIVSLAFWIEVYLALRFVYVDYKCTLHESNTRQNFPKYAILINIVIYILLHLLILV